MIRNKVEDGSFWLWLSFKDYSYHLFRALLETVTLHSMCMIILFDMTNTENATCTQSNIGGVEAPNICPQLYHA